MDRKKIEQFIEFDEIKKLWASFAVTEAAKMQIDEIKPYMSEVELSVKLRETTEGKKFMEKYGNPPVASLSGAKPLLHAAAAGTCLSITELLQIADVCTASARMKTYLNKGTAQEHPLAGYADNLKFCEELRDAVSNTIINEQISGNASKYLKSLRYEIASAEDKMKEKAASAIRNSRNFLSEQFSTMRNGHICIPVKKEYRNKISGNVIDKSASGSTIFVEPASCAACFEELQGLYMEEQQEIQRILYELSDLAASNVDVLEQNIQFMEKLDFVFSKGKLSMAYDGCEPQIEKERMIKLVDARHPLMDKTKCVPLQFSLGGGIRGIVITGPNTGGKTVALKTAALNCMMAQCGLHTSCKEAQICMQSNFLCDIGDGQNISENLSTFSAHITNVLDILKAVNEESLVLIDELGSGTDPLEGMGIAVAILEELKRSGAFFLVTTHYPEIKVYAQRTACLLNARMAFDKEQLKPMYRMEVGEAGESCAFYIAGRLGMPFTMLQRAAEEAYGKDYDIRGLRQIANHKLQKEAAPHVIKRKEIRHKKQIDFHLGDSVLVYPEKKTGIVCKEANEKGVLRVQLPGKKIWINHKRVKLQVRAERLYPLDYDFSIVFDTVEHRKLRHQMERKYVEGKVLEEEG